MEDRSDKTITPATRTAALFTAALIAAAEGADASAEARLKAVNVLREDFATQLQAALPAHQTVDVDALLAEARASLDAAVSS